MLYIKCICHSAHFLNRKYCNDVLAGRVCGKFKFFICVCCGRLFSVLFYAICYGGGMFAVLLNKCNCFAYDLNKPTRCVVEVNYSLKGMNVIFTVGIWLFDLFDFCLSQHKSVCLHRMHLRIGCFWTPKYVNEIHISIVFLVRGLLSQNLPNNIKPNVPLDSSSW